MLERYFPVLEGLPNFDAETEKKMECRAWGPVAIKNQFLIRISSKSQEEANRLSTIILPNVRVLVIMFVGVCFVRWFQQVGSREERMFPSRPPIKALIHTAAS